MSASSRHSRKKAPTPGTTPGARERFLGKLANEGWQKVDDILDVWFDSGSTHAFVLEDPRHFPGLAGIKRKADGGDDTVMYLEGSDQHRGWFQSSLLESCGTRGRAPFDVVLTHGFVLDEDGRKMSKSLGNVTAPQDVIKQSGADILRHVGLRRRLCRRSAHRPGNPQNHGRDLSQAAQHACAGCSAISRISTPPTASRPSTMPELERLMLHRLAELDPLVRAAYADFDYKRIFAALNAFMTVDLSAFYFDIRKDALYCDPYSSVTRKACLTVLDHLFRCTVTWLAPMLCFTAEEAWLARDPAAISVHLEAFPDVPASWRDDALAEKWRKLRNLRRVVTGALELERAAKRIGSSLEAAPDHLCRRCRSVRGRRRRRSCRTLHHLGGDAGRRRGAGCGVPARRRARRRGRAAPRRRPQMRPLVENLAGGRPAIRNIPTSRRATPRRCANGTPCARRRSRDGVADAAQGNATRCLSSGGR